MVNDVLHITYKSTECVLFALTDIILTPGPALVNHVMRRVFCTEQLFDRRRYTYFHLEAETRQ